MFQPQRSGLSDKQEFLFTKLSDQITSQSDFYKSADFASTPGKAINVTQPNNLCCKAQIIADTVSTPPPSQPPFPVQNHGYGK